MEYLSACYTDKGKRKGVNQDSLLLIQAEYQDQDIVFAAVCDGMGGLKKGEKASAEVIYSFEEWFRNGFELLAEQEEFEDSLYDSWEILLQNIHDKIRKIGRQFGIRIGTTLTAMLLWQGNYYIAHVGDSRIYEIKDSAIQLTGDQILANLDDEQGKTGRHILIQGVGCSSVIRPAYYSGRAGEGTTYLLCTDGFRHKVNNKELQEIFVPENLSTEEIMSEKIKYIAELVKERGERDNISAILLSARTGQHRVSEKNSGEKGVLIKKKIILTQVKNNRE